MIVLETNVVSELMRPEPTDRMRVWAGDQEAAAVTSITVAELLYGLARLPRGVRRSQLEESAHWLVYEEFTGRVLPFDRTAAEHYAELAADCDRRGRPIGIADAQIAAICRNLSTPLATRNTRDFEGTGIDLVDPWTAKLWPVSELSPPAQHAGPATASASPRSRRGGARAGAGG